MESVRMKMIITLVLLSTLAFSKITLPVSFSANFEQSVTNAKKKKITYSGKLKFSKKNGIQWHYSKPTKKDVCSDKKYLTIVDHDLEQVSYYELKKSIDLDKIIANAKLHRKSVYTAKYNEKEYTIQVDSKERLSRIAYFDELENTVLLIFTNVKYSNKEIPKSQLECHTPEYYDAING